VHWIIHLDPSGQHNMMKRCKHVNLVRSSNVDGEEEFLFAPCVRSLGALQRRWLLTLPPPRPPPPADTACSRSCPCTCPPAQPTPTPSSSTSWPPSTTGECLHAQRASAGDDARDYNAAGTRRRTCRWRRGRERSSASKTREMFLFLKFSVEALFVSAEAGAQREGHASGMHLSIHFMEAKNDPAALQAFRWRCGPWSQKNTAFIIRRHPTFFREREREIVNLRKLHSSVGWTFDGRKKASFGGVY